MENQKSDIGIWMYQIVREAAWHWQVRVVVR